MRLLTLLTASLFFIACHGSNAEVEGVSLPEQSDDCSKLGNFKSYDEAISKVKETTFKLSESFDTNKSSWIRRASYYSCDGQKGYLIIETDQRPYIHAGVPLSAWNGFKMASSFGSYYDHNIKGRYRLNIK